MNKLFKSIAKFDVKLVLPAAFLLAIGTLVQSSIEAKIVGVDLEISLLTHVLAALGGLVAGLILLFFSLDTWRSATPILYAATLVLLVLVIFNGAEGGGAQRWLLIGGLQIQPTELAKIFLVAALARMLNTHTLRANSLRVLLLSLLTFAVPAGLIALQPDLGSAIVLGVIWLSMLFASKLRVSRFALILILISGVMLLMVPFLAEYQQERLVSYFNPTKDESGASYNVNQSQIAIGSGGMFGNGLEGGSQSQLNFLPSQHTDFIFSVIAEKLGLIGAGITLLALLAVLVRILIIAYRVESQYKRLILIGIFTIFAFHTVVNVGMTMGLVPVTGLPLPFLSYGGTFMFVVVMLTTVAARIEKLSD